MDDAAGEAFDKTAKLLGLGYPGGPAISRIAQNGDPDRFHFPRPMVNRPGLDFSFSGLKTHVRTTAHALQPEGNLDDQTISDIALGFELAVVDTLGIKCSRALKQTGRKRLIIAGGVGANRRLRDHLRRITADIGAEAFYPRPEFCTDNGAMIAYAGYVRWKMMKSEKPETSMNQKQASFDVKPRWSLEDIQQGVDCQR